MDTRKDVKCDIENIKHGEGSKNIKLQNVFELKLLST